MWYPFNKGGMKMKKYLLVFACAALILTTGCGNKKNQLKCTGEQSLGDVKMKVSATQKRKTPGGLIIRSAGCFCG